MTDVIIYHNPSLEPHVIEYLKTPPARPLLASLIARMGVPVRSIALVGGVALIKLG